MADQKKPTPPENMASPAGHEITFIANSGQPMRNGQRVDLETLSVNTANGKKLVSQLTPADTLTVPLLVDHMASLTAQAGTVVSLRLTDKGLEATARLADTDAAALVWKLAEADALTNSFSITVTGNIANSVIRDGELTEISVVFLGMDARALYVSKNNFQPEGKTIMTDMKKQTTPKQKQTAPAAVSLDINADDSQKLTDAVAQAANMIMGKIEEMTVQEGQGDSKDAPENPVTNNSAAATVPAAKLSAPAPVAPAPARPRVSLARTAPRSLQWKDSREGMAAFGLAMLHHRGDKLGVRDEWRSQLAAHSYDLTGTENLIPQPVATGIQDAFNNGGSGLYPMLNKTGVMSWKLTPNMVGLNDTNGAAQPYPRTKYGTVKQKQNITISARNVDSDILAQYVEVAHGDLMRLADSPADLVQYVSQQLPNRLINTIEKGVLFPVTDATGTAAAFHDVYTDATGTPDALSSWLAGSMQAAGETPTIGDLIDLDAMVSAEGARVLITSRQTLATIKRSIAGDGNFIGLGSGAVAEIVGVDKIITPAWWTPAANLGALAIIMVPSHYRLVGSADVSSYSQFMLDSNTDRFLSEQFAGGSLDMMGSAAVLLPKQA